MNSNTEQIEQWIIKGDNDLGTAILTYTHIPKYRDTIGFHCQQATEKYLKAYLIHLDLVFEYKHDISYLILLIGEKDNEFEKHFSRTSKLTEFSVKLRYPNEVIFPTDDDIVQALNTAKEIRELVIKKINISFDTDDIIKQMKI